MPILKNLLVSGCVSINKLSKIASVATIENQEYWAQKTQVLSCRTLETLVRDHVLFLSQNSKSDVQSDEVENFDGLFEPQNTSNFVHVNKIQASECETQTGTVGESDASVSKETMRANDKMTMIAGVTNNSVQLIEYVPTPILSNEVKKKLNELSRKKIDINEIILDALEKREQEIAQEKEVQAEKAEQKRIEQIAIGKTPNRYRTVATNRLIAKEHGDMCSVPLCKNKAKVIHHTNRFSISLSHDSRFLAPLCDPHHQIAHSVDVKVTNIRNKRQRQ